MMHVTWLCPHVLHTAHAISAKYGVFPKSSHVSDLYQEARPMLEELMPIVYLKLN